MSKPKPGRPQGAPNVKETAIAQPSRCGKCSSTERGPYLHTSEQQYSGTFDGLPFTHIVRRRVRCAACGQMRIDISHENRPDAE